MDHIFNNGAMPVPTELWLGICSSIPSQDGTDFGSLELPGVERLDAYDYWPPATGQGITKNSGTTFTFPGLPAGQVTSLVMTATETGTTPDDLLFIIDVRVAGQPLTVFEGESLSFLVDTLTIRNAV